MITIRRARLEDQPEIFKFIQSAYERRWQYKIPERWEWEFVRNPWLKDNLLPVFIAIDEMGKVIGQSCAMIEPVIIGGETHRLSWSVDTMVLPEYRSQGIGSQLQKINDELHELFSALWLLSTTNRKIKMDLGSVDLDPVPVFRRYSKVTSDIFRSANIELHAQSLPSWRQRLSARVQLSFLERLLAALRNGRAGLLENGFRLSAEPCYDIIEVETFSVEVDRLWEHLCPKFFAIVRRDHNWLNWKFVEQPHVTYHRFLMWRDGVVHGYLVLRKGQPPERNIGIIADFFVDPADGRAITTILSFALAYFQILEVSEIMTATTVPEYQRSLIKLGFVKTSEVYPVIHVRTGTPAVEKSLEPGRWFFGKADHDWDQYPLAD